MNATLQDMQKIPKHCTKIAALILRSSAGQKPYNPLLNLVQRSWDHVVVGSLTIQALTISKH